MYQTACANQLFLKALSLPTRQRRAEDGCNVSGTVEACHVTLVLDDPMRNVVTARPVDLRWARANVLFFYTDTERALVLKAYNEHANKYLTEGLMVGAYGPIAWPGIKRAIQCLRQCKDTRAASATVTDNSRPRNANIPACISHLHFLNTDGLDLHVYSRSLNAWSVLPYDLILLTNLQKFVADAVGLSLGKLYWTVGSLHVNVKDLARETDNSTEAGSMFVEPLSSDQAWKELHCG